jgi:hypothetical protein
VASFEAIVVAAADDGLQQQVRDRLKCGEVGTRGRGAGPFVDFDDEVGGDVLGPRRAVVVDDHVFAEHRLDRVAAVDRLDAAGECGVRKQPPDPGEVATVHEFGVGCDQVRDRPVAGLLIARGHTASGWWCAAARSCSVHVVTASVMIDIGAVELAPLPLGVPNVWFP